MYKIRILLKHNI